MAAQDTTFEHNGQAYTVPAEAFDDIEVLEFLEDEAFIKAARQLLGPEQWAQWKDANREGGRVSSSKAEEMLTSLFAATEAGN